MSDRFTSTQLDRIEAKLDRLLAVSGGDPQLPTPDDPDPDGLTPPTEFFAVWDPGTRTVTCSWDPVDDLVEVHERATDPTRTLKATMPPGASERVSSELAGGHPYTWAVRTRRDGEVSAFTEWIELDIPAEGDGSDEPQRPGGGGAPVGGVPHEVLDLRHWTIMLPTGNEGDPDNDYAADWGAIPGVFFVRDGGVVFRTPADGVHSPNSKYPRTEARQMVDADWTKAAWPSSGSHSLTCDMAIDASNLTGRPRINGIQIHDGSDDVCQIMRHETRGLGLAHDDGDSFEEIDPGYRDGDRFLCTILAENDRIKVDYNGERMVDIAKSGSGWYFKFGCYLQSGGASEHSEPGDASGEVTIYRYILTGGGT